MKLSNANLHNKRIIIRVDFNVPIKNNIIQSTKRIDASLFTLSHILLQNPKQLIIISHLGRPKTSNDCSLEPIRLYLEKILKKPIALIKNLDINPNIPIILLENIRHHKEETKDIPSTPLFRQKLTNLCDIYINDAFGCSHRPHSSIIGINPPEKYLGFLVEKEVQYLSSIFNNPGIKTLILGGSKVSDKIQLIENLIPKFNNILIGGGMAFTFLRYFGYEIGSSLFDEEGFKSIPQLLEKANFHKTQFYFPDDVECASHFANNAQKKYIKIEDGIPERLIGLDIGEKTIEKFSKILDKSEIIVWNGPMGVFELSNFENGSKKITDYLASQKNNKITIIGGGDTASCCEKFGRENDMTHVSTGGGASLELLEGKQLPGLEI